MRVFCALASKQRAIVFHGVSRSFFRDWILLGRVELPGPRCCRGKQPVIAE